MRMRNSLILVFFGSFYLTSNLVSNARAKSDSEIVDQIHQLRSEFIQITKMAKQVAREEGVSLSGLEELEKYEFSPAETKDSQSNLTVSNEHLPNDLPWQVLTTRKEKKKKYYLGFNIGPAFFVDQDYLGGVGEIIINEKTGVNGEVFLERHIDEFYFDITFSYSHKNHSSIESTLLGLIDCDGETEHFSSSIGLGYQFSLNHYLDVLLSTKIGWLHANTKLNSPFFGNLYSSGFLFNGALGVETRFRLTKFSFFHLGYEVHYYGKDYPFSSSSFHTLRSGLGFQF